MLHLAIVALLLAGGPALAAPAEQTFTLEDYVGHQWTNELAHYEVTSRPGPAGGTALGGGYTCPPARICWRRWPRCTGSNGLVKTAAAPSSITRWRISGSCAPVITTTGI